MRDDELKPVDCVIYLHLHDQVRAQAEYQATNGISVHDGFNITIFFGDVVIVEDANANCEREHLQKDGLEKDVHVLLSPDVLLNLNDLALQGSFGEGIILPSIHRNFIVTFEKCEDSVAQIILAQCKLIALV